MEWYVNVGERPVLSFISEALYCKHFKPNPIVNGDVEF